jgi:hypothetical protein
MVLLHERALHILHIILTQMERVYFHNVIRNVKNCNAIL